MYRRGGWKEVLSTVLGGGSGDQSGLRKLVKARSGGIEWRRRKEAESVGVCIGLYILVI